ncbi:MAG: OmpA family protein [Bacillota bacterium]
MKKTTIKVVAFFVLAIFNNSFAQLAQSSWSFGFGFKYPRFVNTSVIPSGKNFGTFAVLERDFTEHAGLRLSSNYLHMEGTYSDKTQKTNLLALNYEFIYKFVPCEAVSPYATAGLGNILFKFTENFTNQHKDKFYLDYQLNFGIGAQWRLSESWNLTTEMNYHIAGNNFLDAVDNTNSVAFSGTNNTYTGLNVGFQYYFSKGEPSKLCDIYNGLSSGQEIDYNMIEAIVRKYQSRPIESVDYDKIEDIVKKYRPEAVKTETAAAGNWVLIGVTFDQSSAKFKTEAYPILYNAAQILLQNPDLKVEIQGYTDNTGPDMFNLNLSLQRAVAVRDYLIAHGVNPERLTAVGFGSKNPVAENKTAAGRILNRRIEFKVLNKQ